jgi:PadR family transcriptional regulator, regulatory protein PadR
MDDRSADVMQGTLDLLILSIVDREAMHGWRISQAIQQLSADVLQVTQGSLYPALHRLEHKGWLVSEWGASENNRRAKYYRLTAAGRRALRAEVDTWRRFSGAVEAILGT